MTLTPLYARPTMGETPVTHRSERDWTAIKAAYVEGLEVDGQLVWLSLDEVGQRLGVPKGTMWERSGRESWPAERAAFQRRLEHERQTARAREVARLGADLDVSALRIARNGLSITAAAVAALGARTQARAEALRDNPETTPSAQTEDTLTLERLSRAADQWYALGVRAIGDVQRVRIDVGDEELVVTEQDRDARSLGLVAILSDIGKIGPEVTDVIDVGPARLQLAAAADEAADLGPADAEDQPVHPADADDTQPEPEADGVPAAG